MTLPDSTRAFIEGSAEGIPLAALQEAADRLGAGYRDGRSTMSLDLDDLAALAYAIVRLPATHAAVQTVLRELADLVPDFSPESHLDLGAGPGTAALASREIFPEIATLHLVEQEPAMRRLGRQLPGNSDSDGATFHWHDGDITASPVYPAADLVTLSFALVEVDESLRADLIRSAFKACQDTLVIVEPGTFPGYEAILAARDILIAEGANILAPCPHHGRCPMEGTESWCHFSRRLSRSRLHMRVKGGTLGYEDEKFSYLICSRHPHPSTAARITRPPKATKAAVTMEVCHRDGLVATTIPRREKALWKRAKKLQWGDRWEG